jgi:hypothetical protein
MPLRVVLVLTLAWLALCSIAQGYFAWLWLSDPANPLRHEALIGLTMATFYAWPAALVLAVLRWRFWDESPQPLRRASSTMLAAVVGVFFVFAVFT